MFTKADTVARVALQARAERSSYDLIVWRKDIPIANCGLFEDVVVL